MKVYETIGSVRSMMPRVGASLVALLFAPLADAGVFDVDSTSTADSLEIKAKFYSTRSSDAHSWHRPGLSLSGRITDNLEWGVGTGYGTIRKEDGPTRGGLRDLSVGTKWRFLDHSAAGGITMAIEPELTLPVGDESSGIGSGAAGFALPLRVAKRFQKVRLTGQVGVERTFGRDDDAIDAGVLAEYLVSDQWSFGIEFVADAPPENMSAYHLRSNAGFAWEPSEQFELQMAVGHSLDNRRGSAATVFRLVFEYRP